MIEVGCTAFFLQEIPFALHNAREPGFQTARVMSYLVLARKWRPQSWEEVIGQDHVVTTLKNAVEQNRTAHAYLFSGPRGVGKTTVARILAKTLNCENRKTVSPCGACASCIEISESRSIDVMEIDGASNRGIEDARELKGKIQYTPVIGKYRIYIIDEVHMLTKEAFNALLKTLEEPPGHVIFIFATTEIHRVPGTIVSRCQRFDFHRISFREINDHLKTICTKENIEIDEGALFLIARKADGSVRDGQSILDQMVSFASGRITEQTVVHALGLIENELFFEVTEVIKAKNAEKAYALVDRIVSGGYDLQEFLSGLIEHLRNLLIVSELSSAESIEAGQEIKKQYLEQAKYFKAGDAMRLIRIVNDARLSLRFSDQPRIPLELAMLKMIKMDQTVTIEELLSRLAGNPGAGRSSEPGTPAGQETHSETSRPAAASPVSKKETSSTAAKKNPDALGTKGGPESPGLGNRSGKAENPGGLANPGKPEHPGSLANPGKAENPGGLANPGKPGNPGGAQCAAVGTDPQRTPEPITLDEVQEKWDRIIQGIKEKKIHVGSFLQEGTVLKVTNNDIEIGFGGTTRFHMESIQRAKELVLETIRKVLRPDVTFHCVHCETGKASSGENAAKNPMQLLRDMASENPAVQEFLTDFDPEII